jgi:Arrestin (or S-antigen), N-terminal domain
MFSFLRPDKHELTITLDRPSAVYHAGETVHAGVTLKTRKALAVQEAHIVLLCRERYECRDDGDADDDRSTSASALRFCRTDERECAREVIMRDLLIPAGATQFHRFTATLPPSAHPTWRGGKIVELAWLVKATLEPRNAPAIKAEANVLVISAPSQQADSGGEFGQSSAADTVSLAFSLRSREWVTGKPIEGHLVLRPQLEVELNEIRVELERIEFVPYGTGNTHGDKRVVRLASKTRLPPGETMALPFALAVPHPSPGSGATANASVTWLLRGVLEQGYLRPDIRVEEEMRVHADGGDSP